MLYTRERHTRQRVSYEHYDNNVLELYNNLDLVRGSHVSARGQYGNYYYGSGYGSSYGYGSYYQGNSMSYYGPYQSFSYSYSYYQPFIPIGMYGYSYPIPSYGYSYGYGSYYGYNSPSYYSPYSYWNNRGYVYPY